MLLLLAGGGFGAYRFYKLRERSRESLIAERRAIVMEGRDDLKPYSVDPDTGKLSDVNESTSAENHDPNRPPDIGDFELTERSGRKITNKDLLGQPWAVGFVFSRCAGQCLKISANMRELQMELKGAPVRLVTISVEPNYDTPEVLSNYADGFGADPDRWLFLTGEQDYVYRLLRGYFRQLVQEMTGKDRQKGYEVLHTDDILHIDAQGRIVKRYHGMNDGDMILLRKALLAEAKELAANSLNPDVVQPAQAEKTHEGSEGGP